LSGAGRRPGRGKNGNTVRKDHGAGACPGRCGIGPEPEDCGSGEYPVAVAGTGAAPGPWHGLQHEGAPTAPEWPKWQARLTTFTGRADSSAVSGIRREVQFPAEKLDGPFFAFFAARGPWLFGLHRRMIRVDRWLALPVLHTRTHRPPLYAPACHRETGPSLVVACGLALLGLAQEGVRRFPLSSHLRACPQSRHKSFERLRSAITHRLIARETMTETWALQGNC
jgi:hypothetical protein